MKILLVCMGNICRSPMAEAVVRRMLESNGLAASTTVDSAGPHDFNVGLPPDPRAMDRRNLAALRTACPAQHQHKLTLFLAYAVGSDADEVPDPYGEPQESFDRVLDLIEDSAQGLTRALRLT